MNDFYYQNRVNNLLWDSNEPLGSILFLTIRVSRFLNPPSKDQNDDHASNHADANKDASLSRMRKQDAPLPLYTIRSDFPHTLYGIPYYPDQANTKSVDTGIAEDRF